MLFPFIFSVLVFFALRIIPVRKKKKSKIVEFQREWSWESLFLKLLMQYLIHMKICLAPPLE